MTMLEWRPGRYRTQTGSLCMHKSLHYMQMLKIFLVYSLSTTLCFQKMYQLDQHHKLGTGCLDPSGPILSD